jgi:ribosomal protein L31E
MNILLSVEVIMSNSISVVVTTYGHDKTIDKIAVSVIDEAYDSWRSGNAFVYCNTINALELKGDAWISAKKIEQNTQYILNDFLPRYKFNDIIPNLDDRAVQRIIRSSNSTDIAISLTGKEKEVHEKIFKNMSSRAVEVLKEDIQRHGTMPEYKVKESQQKIVDVIHKLIDTGEIIAPHQGGFI